MRHLKIWIAVLFLFLSLPLTAQVEVQIQLQSNNQFHPDDFWSVAVQNHSAKVIRVFLFGQLKDGEGKSLLMAQTPPIELPPGRTVFQTGMLSTQAIEGIDNLPTGIYTQCVEVMQQDNRQPLGQQCLNRRLTTSTIDKRLPKGSDRFQFHGQARLTGQLSNNPGLFQQQAPNYLRFQATPSVQIMGIPFQSTVFLSTEQDGLRYDLNTINFQFDRATLLSQLQKEATNRIQQAEWGNIPYDLSEWENLKEDAYQEALQKMPEGWEEKLDDKRLEKQLKELKELDRIEQVLKQQAFQQAEASYNKVMRKYGLDPDHPDQQALDSLKKNHPESFQQIQQAQEKYQQYKKLKARYDMLKQQTKALKKLLALQEQKEKLEMLQKKGDPALLADPKNLRRLGLLDKQQALLSKVHKLGVGTIFPFHSQLSLNGLSLKGAELAVAPGVFYVEMAGGQVGRSAIAFDSLNVPENSQKLYAGRFGLGEPQGRHFFVSLLEGREKREEGFTSRDMVVGLEGQWDFFQEKIAIKGEIYQSRNNRGLDSLIGMSPARAGQIEARGKWEEASLDAYGRYAKVSPFYYSPGSPFLIRDRERYEIRIRQRLLKGRMNWQAQLKRDQDNLLPIKYARTTVSSASFSCGWRPKKGPYIQAQYAPFFRENNRSDSLQDQQYLQVIGIQSGYSYTVGKLNLSSNLSINQQISRTLRPEQNFSALSMTLTQSVSFQKPISVFFSLSYLGAAYYSDQNETLGADISGSFTLIRKWQNTFGVQYWDESAGALKQGAYWQSQYPISRYISFELRAELNHFERYHVDLPVWDERMVRGGLVLRW